MPISETYVVQYLLQASMSGGDPVQWYEKESDGFAAQNRGIKLDFDHIPTRAGGRKHLTLSCGMEKVFISEPARTGIFTEKYATPDDHRLAHLMRDLWTACRRQCAARRNRGAEVSNRIRESIFQRLIGISVSEIERPA